MKDKRIQLSARTRLGRFHLLVQTISAMKPVLYPVASLYRQTLLRRCQVIGVVGSFGKSTTTRAIKAVLGMPYDRFPRRSAGAFIAYELLKTHPNQKQCVIEAGITGCGQMQPMARLMRPNIAVVTSIGREHITSLKTLETTRREKAKMVEALPSNGTAILNGDDEHAIWMRGTTNAKIVTYGFGESNSIRASNIEMDWPRGMRFKLHADGNTFDVRTSILGRHMVYPLLAAVAVARTLGNDPEEFLPRLESLGPTSGRLEVLSLPNGAHVVRDDFKSTLETIEKALDVLEEIPARRRFVVLGEISEPPKPVRSGYKRIGKRAAGIADRLVLIGSRTHLQAYASGARETTKPDLQVIPAGHSIGTALDAMIEDLGPGDVVLIKGSQRQRLERIALTLLGQPVRCALESCYAKVLCENCPNLEIGPVVLAGRKQR